jgi:hypothetical protein
MEYPTPTSPKSSPRCSAFTSRLHTINYPLENLPGWLAGINRLLSFYHLGVVVRDGRTVGLVADVSLSYLVLAWLDPDRRVDHRIWALRRRR